MQKQMEEQNFPQNVWGGEVGYDSPLIANDYY